MSTAETLNFAIIYEKYHRRCYLFAKSYVHANTTAEDIASESLIKMWEMSKREPIENLQAVLYTIVRNKALDYLKHQIVVQSAFATVSRKSKRELELRINTLEAGYPEKIFSDEIERIIEETLSSLPEKTQQIFSMYRFNNLSKPDIAQKIGLSVKGIDYHLSVALAVLRKNLKDYFPLLFFFYFR